MMPVTVYFLRVVGRLPPSFSCFSPRFSVAWAVVARNPTESLQSRHLRPERLLLYTLDLLDEGLCPPSREITAAVFRRERREKFFSWEPL